MQLILEFKTLSLGLFEKVSVLPLNLGIMDKRYNILKKYLKNTCIFFKITTLNFKYFNKKDKSLFFI